MNQHDGSRQSSKFKKIDFIKQTHSIDKSYKFEQFRGLSQSYYGNSYQGSVLIKNDNDCNDRLTELKVESDKMKEKQLQELDKKKQIEMQIDNYIKEINEIKEKYLEVQDLQRNQQIRFRGVEETEKKAMKELLLTQFNLQVMRNQVGKIKKVEKQCLDKIQNEKTGQADNIVQQEKQISIVMIEIDKANKVIHQQQQKIANLNIGYQMIRNQKNQYKDLEQQVQCIDNLKEIFLEGGLDRLSKPFKIEEALRKHKLEEDIFQRIKQSGDNEITDIIDRLIQCYNHQTIRQNTFRNRHQQSVNEKKEKNKNIDKLDNDLVYLISTECSESDQSTLQSLNILKLDRLNNNSLQKNNINKLLQSADKFIFYTHLSIVNQILRLSIIIQKLFNKNIFKKSSERGKSIVLNSDQQTILEQAHFMQQKYNKTQNQKSVYEKHQKRQSQSISFTQFTQKSVQAEQIIKQLFPKQNNNKMIQTFITAIQKDYIMSFTTNPIQIKEYVKQIGENTHNLMGSIYKLKLSGYKQLQNNLKVLFSDFCQLFFQLFKLYRSDDRIYSLGSPKIKLYSYRNEEHEYNLGLNRSSISEPSVNHGIIEEQEQSCEQKNIIETLQNTYLKTQEKPSILIKNQIEQENQETNTHNSFNRLTQQRIGHKLRELREFNNQQNSFMRVLKENRKQDYASQKLHFHRSSIHNQTQDKTFNINSTMKRSDVLTVCKPKVQKRSNTAEGVRKKPNVIIRDQNYLYKRQESIYRTYSAYQQDWQQIQSQQKVIKRSNSSYRSQIGIIGMKIEEARQISASIHKRIISR